MGADLRGIASRDLARIDGRPGALVVAMGAHVAWQAVERLLPLPLHARQACRLSRASTRRLHGWSHVPVEIRRRITAVILSDGGRCQADDGDHEPMPHAPYYPWSRKGYRRARPFI